MARTYTRRLVFRLSGHAASRTPALHRVELGPQTIHAVAFAASNFASGLTHPFNASFRPLPQLRDGLAPTLGLAAFKFTPAGLDDLMAPVVVDLVTFFVFHAADHTTLHQGTQGGMVTT